MIDAPDGTGRLLVRPGWARLGGPLEGRLRAVWFRGPHSDHLVDTPLGEVLIREPGTAAVRGRDVHGLDPRARLAARRPDSSAEQLRAPASGSSGR